MGNTKTDSDDSVPSRVHRVKCLNMGTWIAWTSANSFLAAFGIYLDLFAPRRNADMFEEVDIY